MNWPRVWSVASFALVAAGLAGAPGAGHAAVTCRFESNSSVAFGPYDVTSTTPTDSLATVLVRCDSSTGGNPSVTVTLSVSPGASGSSRRMRHLGSSGDVLTYGLFRDAARSAAWGFTAGVDTVSQNLKIQNNRSAQASFTIYGRIPPLQDVTPGDYVDTVQVTLSP